MAATVALPRLTTFAQGETLVRNESLGMSIARFFMKTKLALTSERLAGESPKTSFWFIPKGAAEFNYPLADVTGIGIYTTRRTLRLVAGLALLVGGLWNLQGLWIFSILGALLLLTAFKAVLSVTDDTLLNHNLEISLHERGTAQSFVDQVKAAIAARPPVVRNAWFTGKLGL